jgi:hypothetical protein
VYLVIVFLSVIRPMLLLSSKLKINLIIAQNLTYFAYKVSSLYSFCSTWWDEISHQFLSKGNILIKDAHYLDPIDYFDPFFALVDLSKRSLSPL